MLGTDASAAAGVVVTVVLGLVLDGRDRADLAVQPSVVEPVDVLGDGDLEVVDVLPRPLVADQLGLEQRVERLGQSVVVGITGRADGGDRASVGEPLRVAQSEVLLGFKGSLQHLS